MKKGFVFATTGKNYTNMARRAARNLRQVMPNIEVDLFTDQNINDPIFSKIHSLRHLSKRPKMEAIRKSRFQRTIYLDSDLIILYPILDVFNLLDFAPLAGVQAMGRQKFMMQYKEVNIPNSFPLINSGLIAVQKSNLIEDLMKEWEQKWINKTSPKLDQPILRYLLFKKKITPIIMPVEYNLIQLSSLLIWRKIQGPIKGLHIINLKNQDHSNWETPIKLKDVLPFKIYNAFKMINNS